jgi:hypothetical protein
MMLLPVLTAQVVVYAADPLGIKTPGHYNSGLKHSEQ